MQMDIYCQHFVIALMEKTHGYFKCCMFHCQTHTSDGWFIIQFPHMNSLLHYAWVNISADNHKND